MDKQSLNDTITPSQAASKPYLKALSEEIMLGGSVSLKELENSRINHPDILTYKSKMIGGGEKAYSHYADWIDFLITDYGPRTTCLSLGSGLGRVEKYLIEQGFSEKIETIELCANVNKKNRINDAMINVQKGDLNFIQLSPNTYDFILCHGVLHHLINLEHVLTQINNALTEDGLLLIYEYVGETRWQFSKDRMDILEKHFPEVSFNIPPRWKVGGFESVRSGELLNLIKTCFTDNCERSVSYGGIYFPFVTCAKASDDIQMKRVVEIDEAFSKSGEIPPCYHMGLYRKCSFSPPLAKPWSDEKVKSELEPPKPFSAKMYQQLKTSYLGEVLRKIKKFYRP